MSAKIHGHDATVHATRASCPAAELMSYLDQILALGLGNQRLELRRRECIDEASFGHDEEEHLGACQD